MSILFIVLGIYNFQFIQSYAGHNVTSKQNSKLLLRWHSSKKSKDYCLVRLTGWLIIELRFKLGTRPWDFKGEIVWPWGFNFLNYVLKIWNLAIWDRPLNSIKDPYVIMSGASHDTVKLKRNLFYPQKLCVLYRCTDGYLNHR